MKIGNRAETSDQGGWDGDLQIPDRSRTRSLELAEENECGPLKLGETAT
jgi:hypothetical protein